MVFKLLSIAFLFRFFQRFNTGAVSIAWQEEMVETKVYDDLNIFGPDNVCLTTGGLPNDLDFNFIPEPEPKGCFPFLRKKFKVINIKFEKVPIEHIYCRCISVN